MNFLASEAGNEGGFWFGPSATRVAEDAHWVFFFILWVSAIFFAIIVFMGTLFVVRYRRREGVAAVKTPHHNTALELLWSVIPTILVVMFFWYGFEVYLDMRRVPPSNLDVNVKAQKWAWSYTYPNGMVTDELVVPKGKNVRLIISAVDVLHSFAVPDFAVKMDAVPGRYNEAWFNAPNPGEHVVFCTEYCGAQHSRMLSKVRVLDEDDYRSWYEKTANFMDDPTISPVDKGEKLWRVRGCAACHSLDGVDNYSAGGPSFKGTWGTERPMTDGTKIKMDENYVRQSILEPNVHVVANYPQNRMPNYQGQLSEQAIDYLIAFIKAQKEQ